MRQINQIAHFVSKVVTIIVIFIASLWTVSMDASIFQKFALVLLISGITWLTTQISAVLVLRRSSAEVQKMLYDLINQ